MQRIKEAYKRTAPSDGDYDAIFATPSWVSPTSKRSCARTTAYKKRTATTNDDVRRMEAFERPAVKVPAITQPTVKVPVATTSPSSLHVDSQSEGCPLTKPEDDDGSDSSESESPTPMPTLYVLPDATVIATLQDTVAVFRPLNPDEVMTQDVCKVIFEEVMLRKVILECRNSRLSVETVTRNVCQDVAAVIISTEWQKELRRQIQSHLK